MTLKSVNPTTGKLIKEFKEPSLTEIKTQIEKTSNAFKRWKESTYADRKQILKNAAKLLHENKLKYSRLMTLEMGKPINQSKAEIEKCAWLCDYYSENGEKFLEDEHVKTDADISYIHFSPLGVILAVMPWNFPFWQVFRCAVPALMAGNTVLLKHSSNVPQCANTIEDIFKQAGLPNHVFQNLSISSKVIDKIIADNRISAVSLTGSTTAGKSAAKVAGSCIKKVVLELGGSDPFIVLEDADLPYTIDQAVESRMINNGQSCIAAKRLIVVNKVFERFKEDIFQKIENLKVGDPMDPNTDIGPLARIDILEQLDNQIKNSVKKGAKILTGGKKTKDSGFFYSPTLISNVKKGMPVYEEETFGPVATLMKVENKHQALQVANDTCYGLGASIWTKKIEKARALTKYLDAGNIFVNEVVKSDPRLPFGGIKKSGYGRELSNYGIKEFVNIQTIYIKKP